jgi:beta-lactam-binding protein with PASTA domain
MRRTLKSFAGLVLAIAFLAAIGSLFVILASLSSGHIGDISENAVLTLASAAGAILAAGLLWTLIEIADDITAAKIGKNRD